MKSGHWACTRRPRELPQVPAAVLGSEAADVIGHTAAGEVQVDGVVYIKMVDGVVDMLLRIHVVPARRDRFEVRVRAAAEQLARRLARGLAAAPRLAGGEGRASRAAPSDHCEPQ